MMITGSYLNGNFRMHAPAFPYDSTTFVGYTLKGMKRKYREMYNLKGRHIEWIIVGL